MFLPNLNLETLTVKKACRNQVLIHTRLGTPLLLNSADSIACLILQLIYILTFRLERLKTKILCIQYYMMVYYTNKKAVDR